MSRSYTRRLVARVSVVLVAAAVCRAERVSAGPPSEAGLPRVVANDNRRPAGTQDGRTRTLALRAGAGRWTPEGPGGPGLTIEAFGEMSSALMVPAPLIRVEEGTEIAVSIRNDLDAALTVHGLCTRDGTPCAPLEVSAGQTREVRFASGRPGTYHYWATTIGAPVPFRELAGAFVVDPAGAKEADRVLVITEWTDLTPAQLRDIIGADDPTAVFVSMKPRLTFVINGLSWPATERFTYQLGEKVKWRVVNLSSQAHPLHLHGFYFDVESRGNGMREETFDEARRRRVVTELVPSGGTIAMTWTPEREGNWLFHCHIMHHVSLDRRLGGGHPADQPGQHHAGHEAHRGAAAGMAGMVIGIAVRGAAAGGAAGAASAATAVLPRKLTLVMKPVPGGGTPARTGFALAEDPSTDAANVASPGPPIVLRRGEPVEITLVNELGEPTAIHWHGIELESYYDGVHGYSGVGGQVTPMIQAGATFVVRMTPPRAGTFIYHTHLHDYRQLSSGMYGALIVTNPGETFDPVTDHVVVLGRSGLRSAEPSLLTEADSVVVNGERAPRFVWKAGQRHRVRLINITPDDIFDVSLQTAAGPVTWTPVAKDGAPVPSADVKPGPARQVIAVGETYEFEYLAPESRRSAWLEVRTTGGKWQAQGHITIK